MTFAATKPCEWCGRKLGLEFGTVDGELVEVAERCPCPDARWRRAECVDCGVRVPRKSPKRLGKKRCPRHHKREYNAQRRRYMKKLWDTDPGKREAQKRRHRKRERQRRRFDRTWREQQNERRRHYYATEKRVRGKPYRPWWSVEARQLRDRVAYHLRHDEDWTFTDIASLFGFTDRAAAKWVREQERIRTPELRRAA